MKLVLASNNKHKLSEFREMLERTDIAILSQKEAGLELEVEENGTTFEQNAFLKAEAACKALGIPAMADDSGLVTEALNGEPGVYSARYGGEGLDDEGRYRLLLRNMENTGNRNAMFVSAIVCVFPNGDVLQARGECRGVILRAPRGENGFGYDPVFYIPELGRSMAELTMEEKNAISHRGAALVKFRKIFEEYLKEEHPC